MTVSSLWKVLDDANCGKAVGLEEILDPSYESRKERLKATNPWNYNQQQQLSRAKKKPVTLAVDLSIWICESLTSSAMAENHLSPPLHLVFSRTVKLLSSGVKLVVVVEGKRRIRTESNSDDNFHKRRSGTAFWKACGDCKAMLELLGVPVVQAKAEAEALCALLNQRGIVDGVISNDGDCLVFGTKVLYTRFSMENLDQSKVIRYDLDKLKARIRATTEVEQEEVGTLALSRHDLVAFALLTGSDLVGPGLPQVGYSKAIRFIRKCQLDNPLRVETAAITEMKSWELPAPVWDHTCLEDVPKSDRENQKENEASKSKSHSCCSRCSHRGDKRSHQKYGCEQCGTKPGEPCMELTTEDRFRKAIRAKALAMVPTFEPSKISASYERPNGNQVPAKLAKATSQNLVMGTPNLQKLLEMKLIVKGRSYEASQEYLKLKVGQLLSRMELLGPSSRGGRCESDQSPENNVRFSRNRPEPVKILKAATRDKIPVYEIQWRVNATLTDEEGNGIDGYEYSSFEKQELVKLTFPKLIAKFEKAEKERQKQGDGEQERRKEFLQSLFMNVKAPAENEHDKRQGPNSPSERKGPSAKQRATFFQKGKIERARVPAHTKKAGGEARLLFRLAGRFGIGRGQRACRSGNDQKGVFRGPNEMVITTCSSIETKSRDPFLLNKRKKRDSRALTKPHGGRDGGNPQVQGIPTSIKVPMFRCSPIQSPPTSKLRLNSPISSRNKKDTRRSVGQDEQVSPLNTASKEETICQMGGFLIQMTPIQTSRRKLDFGSL